jgi:hypothetical protein
MGTSYSLKHYKAESTHLVHKKGEQMAKRTPIKAIRAKCLDCACGQFVEVRECPVKECPLWEYRLGHRPKEEPQATDEENVGEEV